MTERILVRTIVCAYTRDELPTSWVQVFRRFEHAVRVAALRIRVRLDPLEELPETYEVLAVAPDLADRARSLAPAARTIVATRDDAAAVSAALLREIEEGVTLYADRARPDDPVVVVHRGPEIL